MPLIGGAAFFMRNGRKITREGTWSLTHCKRLQIRNEGMRIGSLCFFKLGKAEEMEEHPSAVCGAPSFAESIKGFGPVQVASKALAARGIETALDLVEPCRPVIRIRPIPCPRRR